MDAIGEFHNNIEELEAIDSGRYENIFRMFITKDKYFYNILRRVNIDINIADPNIYDTTTIQYETPWTTISYRAYGTTDLWWMIYITNKHQVRNPVDLVPGGTKLYIIKSTFLRTILDEIDQELTPKV
tara:strand:+ start:53 stop:436 length:384 start_codon:yes stop_codon:yes gene_type:complete